MPTFCYKKYCHEVLLSSSVTGLCGNAMALHYLALLHTYMLVNLVHADCTQTMTLRLHCHDQSKGLHGIFAVP